MDSNTISAKRLMIYTAIGGALNLLSAAPVADEYQAGITAYNKGYYIRAFKLIKRGAEQGDVKSQYALSTMYRRGLGVEADEYEGFYWCKRAAEEGYLEAQFQLGLMYLEGEGVTQDEDEAQNWLWSAADRGYPQASEVLTYIFSENYDVEQGLGC